ISGFLPASGPSGTRVTINGNGFDGSSRVTYGEQQLDIVGRHGDTAVNVVIPRGAQNQPFTVSTRAGAVSSATAFQVVEYSTVAGIAPDRGPVGTKVTITMTGGYDGNDQFWLGNLSLPVLEKAPGRYVVQIPAGATTGRIV